MKKIAYSVLILSSGLILSACGLKNTSSPVTQPSNNTIQQQPVDDQSLQPSGTPDGKNAPTIDYTAAAKTLGVTEAALKSALGVGTTSTDGKPTRPDFAAAAKTLGITTAKLQEALGMPSGTPPQKKLPNSGPEFDTTSTDDSAKSN